MKNKKRIFAILLVILVIMTTTIYIFKVYLPEKQAKAELIADVERYYNSKIEGFWEENKGILPGEIEVAFIGDSLTDGYDLGRYYPDLKTLNRGIGGDTTFGVEKRLEVSLYEIQPEVVVMLIGANNMSEMFENYENILIDMKKNLPESHIVLLSLTSMGGAWGKNNHLAAYNNVKIKALAEKYGFEFVDIYTPLLNLSTDEIYPEYTTDGGHLTHEGYTVLTEEIRPVLDRLLDN